MNKLPLSQLLGLLESAEDEPERDCIRKAILRQRSITLAAPSSSSDAPPSTDMVVAPTASDASSVCIEYLHCAVAQFKPQFEVYHGSK